MVLEVLLQSGQTTSLSLIHWAAQLGTDQTAQAGPALHTLCWLGSIPRLSCNPTQDDLSIKFLGTHITQVCVPHFWQI